MIIGTGIDIVELSRIQKLMERQPRFVERILTEKEREKYATLASKRQVEYVAGRFAAKEAYAKANGTGIGSSLSFHDMEILNDQHGKPIFHCPSSYRIHISISHGQAFVVAQVIIEST